MDEALRADGCAYRSDSLLTRPPSSPRPWTWALTGRPSSVASAASGTRSRSRTARLPRRTLSPTVLELMVRCSKDRVYVHEFTDLSHSVDGRKGPGLKVRITVGEGEARTGRVRMKPVMLGTGLRRHLQYTVTEIYSRAFVCKRHLHTFACPRRRGGWMMDLHPRQTHIHSPYRGASS